MKQEPEMHPRTQLLHGGDRASQGARLDQDHRPLMGPAGGARLDRTTAP